MLHSGRGPCGVTLEKVQRLFQPNLVILEATGSARPSDITRNLRDYGTNLDAIQIITLVDPNRHEMLIR